MRMQEVPLGRHIPSDLSFHTEGSSAGLAGLEGRAEATASVVVADAAAASGLGPGPGKNTTNALHNHKLLSADHSTPTRQATA